MIDPRGVDQSSCKTSTGLVGHFGFPPEDLCVKVLNSTRRKWSECPGDPSTTVIM